MQSPFITHRDKILGHYSTASWLRNVVMALWNGSGHPVGLSQLTNLDAKHFAAFNEMLVHYRAVGENDEAFHRLVAEIELRPQDEQAAAEREERLEGWCKDTKRAMRALGKSADEVDDRYEWFAAQFDSGLTPEAAAAAAQ